jgi:hypothetical protein
MPESRLKSRKYPLTLHAWNNPVAHPVVLPEEERKQSRNFNANCERFCSPPMIPKRIPRYTIISVRLLTAKNGRATGKKRQHR